SRGPRSRIDSPLPSGERSRTSRDLGPREDLRHGHHEGKALRADRPSDAATTDVEPIPVVEPLRAAVKAEGELHAAPGQDLLSAHSERVPASERIAEITHRLAQLGLQPGLTAGDLAVLVIGRERSQMRMADAVPTDVHSGSRQLPDLI